MDWKSSLESLRSVLPEGEEPEVAHSETAAEDASSERARLDIILDRKGRKGKPATIIAGFTIPDEAIEALAKELRRALGVGGSQRGGEILVQGDKRREVLDFLSARSIKARII